MSRWARAFLAALVLAWAPAALHAAAGWGTYLKPFAADSLWNSRPIDPVLSDYEIPTSNYYPAIAEGAWSLGVYVAREGDPPVAITGAPGRNGVWDPDWEQHRDRITIPRWPAGVEPASGSDGHADIVDPVAGIVHSFFMLTRHQGQWVARQYAWSRLDGRGWGDPAHYYQGSRATGVPAMAGLIRKHEVKDGDHIYRHALALSLTFNALSPDPAYAFPATAADAGAKQNSGAIPQGALLMLPASFDTTSIANADLKKIAETLKVYGAYVVDRNHGTPFRIYVENGAGFSLHGGRWDTTVARELQRIRAALRQVVSASGWVDGNGARFTPERNLNRLSMRGPWRVESGPAAGAFDTWRQAVVFPETAERIVQVNTSSRGMKAVAWAAPVPGAKYRLTAVATGGAKLRLVLRDRGTGRTFFDSKELGDGDAATFVWPGERTVGAILHAMSGVGQPSSVRGILVAAGDREQ